MRPIPATICAAALAFAGGACTFLGTFSPLGGLIFLLLAALFAAHAWEKRGLL